MNSLIRDLYSLSENELQKKYYNVDLNNDKPIIDDGFVYTSLSNFLKELELDKTLTSIYYNLYKGDGTCFDANEFLFDYMNFSETDYYSKTVYNTYNYDSNLECIIQFSIAYDDRNNEYYMALEVHNGGDARCNYSEMLFYKYIGDIDYLFDVLENCYVYINTVDNFCFDVRGNETTAYFLKEYDDIFHMNTYDFMSILEELNDKGVKIEASSYEY